MKSVTNEILYDIEDYLLVHVFENVLTRPRNIIYKEVTVKNSMRTIRWQIEDQLKDNIK